MALVATSTFVALGTGGVTGAYAATGQLDACGGESATVGSALFFSADDGVHGCELWRTDGSTGGTYMVRDIDPRTDYSDGGPLELTALNGAVFFMVNDGVHGRELWRSDGTEAGTSMLKEIIPGTETALYDFRLLTVGDRLYFNLPTNQHGTELWTSDGTSAGTAMVKDIRPGDGGSQIRELGAIDDIVYFTADDGTHGDELWRSDGTEVGTTMVRDLTPSMYASTDPGNLTTVGDQLFFTVQGNELWVTDGTSSGTTFVHSIESDPDANSYSTFSAAAAGGNLLFINYDTIHGAELWSTTGTTADTELVKDIHDGTSGAGIASFDYSSFRSTLNDELYFGADDGLHGRELWKSDGTAAGTVMVKDIELETDTSYDYAPLQMLTGGGNVFFAGDDGQNGNELWASDGSSVGTRMVSDLNPNGDSNPTLVGTVGATLYFTATNGSNGLQLWRTDGTPAGTSRVVGAAPDPTPTQPTSTTPTATPTLTPTVTPTVTATAAPTAPPTQSPTPTTAQISQSLSTLLSNIGKSGKPKVGKTLKLTNVPTSLRANVRGTVSYTFRWYAGTKKLKNNKAALKLVKTMKGKAISVNVSATSSSVTRAVKVKFGKVK